MFRIRGDVDNQLGHLHSIIGRYLNNKSVESLKFKCEDSDQISISTDVIPIELAKKAREFAQQIPFDKELPLMDDEDNKPRDLIFRNLQQDLKANLDKKADPKNWIWEKYNQQFLRATPLNLLDFINSPIFELITVLESKWQKHLSSSFGISSFDKTVWVLQRIPQGSMISPHDDFHEGRQISFVYYLTPDDWSQEDGGQLKIVKPELLVPINISPTFNTMVSWNMIDSRSPTHWVSEVKCDKPRISLVGFFL